MRVVAGDKVSISGGYEPDPDWLNGASSAPGTILKFIPGQNREPAAVVVLDQSIRSGDAEGRFLVLELRYFGAEWKYGETVHLELLAAPPEEKRWQDRKKGKWIESHATIRKQ